jgi:hypothetical protein
VLCRAGSTGSVELLILAALIAFAAALGTRHLGGSVERSYAAQADKVDRLAGGGPGSWSVNAELPEPSAAPAGSPAPVGGPAASAPPAGSPAASAPPAGSPAASAPPAGPPVASAPPAGPPAASPAGREPGLTRVIRDAVRGATLGGFDPEPTVAGVIAQIAVGFTPAGLAADLRDLTAAGNEVRQGADGAWVNLGIAAASVIPLGDSLKLLRINRAAEGVGGGGGVAAIGRRPRGDPRAAHEAITHDLFHGQVIDAKRFSADGNRNPLYKVRLRDPGTGREREAPFKPRTWGDGQGWNRVPVEYVAYQLNRLLDMDYVAPVAYRRNLDVDFQNWSEGALIHFVPDAHQLKKVPARELGFRRDLFDSDVRILDVLLENSDRHSGNVMRGRHWVDGETRPVLIDQAAGLRREARVTMTGDDVIDASYNPGPIEVVRESTYRSLQNLEHSALENRVGEFVTDDEIRGLLRRRDDIVEHFQDLARKRGRDRVIINDDG